MIAPEIFLSVVRRSVERGRHEAFSTVRGSDPSKKDEIGPDFRD